MTKRDRELLRTIVEKCETLYRTTKDEGLKASLKVALDALKIKDGTLT